MFADAQQDAFVCRGSRAPQRRPGPNEWRSTPLKTKLFTTRSRRRRSRPPTGSGTAPGPPIWSCWRPAGRNWVSLRATFLQESAELQLWLCAQMCGFRVAHAGGKLYTTPPSPPPKTTKQNKNNNEKVAELEDGSKIASNLRCSGIKPPLLTRGGWSFMSPLFRDSSRDLPQLPQERREVSRENARLGTLPPLPPPPCAAFTSTGGAGPAGVLRRVKKTQLKTTYFYIASWSRSCLIQLLEDLKNFTFHFHNITHTSIISVYIQFSYTWGQIVSKRMFCGEMKPKENQYRRTICKLHIKKCPPHKKTT